MTDPEQTMPTTLLPSPDLGTRTAPDWRARTLRDTGYCLAALPLAIPAFVVAVAGLSVGVSLLGFAVGLPALAVTAHAVRGFAHLERQRLAPVLGRPVPAPVYASPAVGDGWVRRALTVVRDPQSWFDLLWAVLGLGTSIVATVVAITWWGVALGGLTYWVWERFLPHAPGDTTLAGLLGLGPGRGPEIWLDLGLGAAALVTMPFVLRLGALAHAHLGAVLLSSRAEVQRELARTMAGREAARTAEADSFRRLERDIHDGPQQRLVRLAMDLGRARRQLDQDPEAAGATLDAALAQARDAVDELRSLSRGIAPPVLVDRGLAAALEEILARSAVPVHAEVGLDRELPPHIETAVYFVVSEALTNVAKHAAAARVDLLVRTDGDLVRVAVTDDGAGGAHLSKGHGLAGLEHRVRAADGVLRVSSPAGGPTTVEAELPCGW
jgi:signal transduction histidine kinase